MIQKKLFLLLLGLILPSLVSAVYAEDTLLQFELTYPNGDRVSLTDSKLIIESGDNQVYRELIGNSSMMYFTDNLPLDKRYEVLVYVHDMLVGSKYFHLDDKSNEIIKIPITPSVGLRFFVYYDDGKTPIENANLKLLSHEGNLIKSAKTDADGKTLRYWVSSTNYNNDHYNVEVSLNDDNLIFEYPNVTLTSGNKDFKIITDWPSTVDFIKINTNADLNKDYVAELYRDSELQQSAYFVRGSAHMPNLEVGDFQLVIFEKQKPGLLLANTTITINENYEKYEISLNAPIINNFNQNLTNHTTEQIEQLDSSLMLLKWIKQSSSGIQTMGTNSDFLLQLESMGDSDVVFTRSTLDNFINFENKMIELQYSVSNPDSLKQFWVYFSGDDFNSWYTYKIPIAEIIPNQANIAVFDLTDADITGNPDLTTINQYQIRIMDKGVENVLVTIHDFEIIDSDQNENNLKVSSCNCVAFRLDDIQDFFLTDIQMELVNTFQQNSIDLTIGVIANNIGKDLEITEFVSGLSDDPTIEFANHGYDHEDFSQFGAVGQEMLLLRANDKLSEMFGIKPTVFIPPLNAYNSDTISALKAQGFTHFSSELDFAIPPFPLSGQVLYHFPETAFTGELNEERTRFVGKSADFTLNQIQDSISNYGYAVVTLHPQEFALFYNSQYQNKVNYQQIEHLELLFDKIESNNIRTVKISEINTHPNEQQLVPQWVKNNAQWWIEEKVSTEEFVNSMEYLITQNIIVVSDIESSSTLTSIPNWVKTNIQWWTEGQTSDAEFISATEFLIEKGIIQI